MVTGCYTVIIHQKKTGFAENKLEGRDHVSGVISDPTSCTSCHSEAENSWDRPAGETFGPNSLWIYYYDTGVPWWVEQRSEESAQEDGESDGLGDTGMRRYYGRRREALNSGNVSSSIVPSNSEATIGGAFIPSFPASIPSSGGTITTTLSTDSSNAQNRDSSQTRSDQSTSNTGKLQNQNTKRGYGLRKDAKKK